MCIHAHTGTTRQVESLDDTATGHEVTRRLLCIDAELHCMPKREDLTVCQQAVSAGNPYLLFDQIHAGDHLAHWVLHLDARIHLHEVEVPFRICQELQSSCASVTQPVSYTHLTLPTKR